MPWQGDLQTSVTVPCGPLGGRGLRWVPAEPPGKRDPLMGRHEGTVPLMGSRVETLATHRAGRLCVAIPGSPGAARRGVSRS